MAHLSDLPDLSSTIEELRTARTAWRQEADGRHSVARFPSLVETGLAVDDLVAALFPGRLGMFAGPVEREDAFVEARLRQGLARLQSQIEREFAYWQE